MPVRAKEFMRTITLRRQIEASRGLQIAVALAVIISALMLLGTIFAAPVLIDAQYRAIETRGRERAPSSAGPGPIPSRARTWPRWTHSWPKPSRGRSINSRYDRCPPAGENGEAPCS